MEKVTLKQLKKIHRITLTLPIAREFILYGDSLELTATINPFEIITKLSLNDGWEILANNDIGACINRFNVYSVRNVIKKECIERYKNINFEIVLHSTEKYKLTSKLKSNIITGFVLTWEVTKGEATLYFDDINKAIECYNDLILGTCDSV